MAKSITSHINRYSFTAALVSLAVVNGAVDDNTYKLGVIYYGILILTLLLTFFQSPIKKVSFNMAILYIACILSIVINDIPEVYTPWMRFVLFFIVTLITSPFIQSYFLDKFRLITFNYLQFLLVVVTIISIFFFVSGSRDDLGLFKGFTSHSMLLAPIAATSMLTLLYWLYSEKLNKPLAYALIALTFVVLLLSGSRISLAGMMASVLFFFYRLYKKQSLKFGKILVSVIVLLAVSYPLWEGYMENLERKNRASINERTGEQNLFSTREIMWSERIREFKSSPLLGIGFCHVPYVKSIDDRTGKREYSEKSTGTIEPGSSWLGTLSMTGLFGFSMLVILWLRSFSMCFKLEQRNRLLAAYLGSVLVFWSINMIAEGHIFSAGGTPCFLSWIIVGAINSAYNKTFNL